MAAAVSNSLSELDAMLNDMRNHKYSGGAIGGARTPNAMDDYSSDYGGLTTASMMSDNAPTRPPPPASYANYAGLPATAEGASEGKGSRTRTRSGDRLKLPPRVRPPKLQVRR